MIHAEVELVKQFINNKENHTKEETIKIINYYLDKLAPYLSTVKQTIVNLESRLAYKSPDNYTYEEDLTYYQSKKKRLEEVIVLLKDLLNEEESSHGTSI